MNTFVVKGSNGFWHTVCIITNVPSKHKTMKTLKNPFMKNLTLIVALFFLGWTASANTSGSIIPSFKNYGEAFIFVEGGVEFAVYPNGEFDFYFDPRFATTSVVHIAPPRHNISYNAGYSYDGFVQYDDYGAVIQIENVPVYYDYYGRIIQAGNVPILYNHAGRVARVGNLQIQYNRFNRPVRYVGFINSFNTHYVYRPWHRYYVRPHSNYRIVYYEPYRAFYEPIRYDYYQFANYYQVNNYYYNKNNFYRPGQQTVSYNYGRRTSAQRDTSPAVRSSENSSRSRVADTPEVNTGRSSASEGRRTIDTDVTGSSFRSSERLEMHENAVRAQRERNTSRAYVPTRSAVTVDTEVNNSSERVQARMNSRRSTATETDFPQQRQSTARRSSSSESRNNVSTQNDVNVRQQSLPERPAEVRSSGRSGGEGRTSRVRG